MGGSIGVFLLLERLSIFLLESVERLRLVTVGYELHFVHQIFDGDWDRL